MTIFELKAVIFLVIALVNFIFAFLLWKKGKSKATFHLGLFALFAGLYAFSVGGSYFFLEKNNQLSLIFSRTSWLGLFMLPAFLTFTYYFTERARNLPIKSFFFSSLLYISALVIVLLTIFTPLTYKQVYSRGVFIEGKFGVLDPIGRIYILLVIILAIGNLFIYYNKVKGFRRIQTRYFLVGTIFFALGGFIVAGLVPLFFKTISYAENVTYLSIIWVALTSYAILRYRLMDIELLIGKAVAYLLLFVTAIFLTFLLVLFNQTLDQPFSFQAAIPFIILITILLFQLFKFYEKLGERYFYPTFYQTKIAITQLEERLQRIFEVETLSLLLSNTLKNIFAFEKIAIISKDLEKPSFQISFNNGFKEIELYFFIVNKFLHSFLERNPRLLTKPELPLLIKKKKGEEKENLEELKTNLETIGVEIIIPLLFEHQLIGIILIGEKANREGFFSQEIDLLESLSQQVSLALKNATLFTEVQKRKEELEHFYRLTVEKELKMRQMARKIKQLKDELKKRGSGRNMSAGY
jgi:hypothetical protein